VVTSWDAFTGENFRRGGFLPQEQRYERAESFLGAARRLFDSWSGDEILADKASGVFLDAPRPGRFAVHDNHFHIEGHFNVPRSPQGRPVIFQAGDSDAGREFAAASADHGLRVALWWWIPGMLLVTGTFVFLYRNFAGRVEARDGDPARPAVR